MTAIKESVLQSARREFREAKRGRERAERKLKKFQDKNSRLQLQVCRIIF